jgi:hypothetical protein
MRWTPRAALLICIAPLPAVGQSVGQNVDDGSLAAARSAIEACTQRLDPQVDIGYDRISARCPDLARTLERSELEQWLPAGWKEARNNLSAGSLRELRAVVERELETRPGARTPRVVRAGSIAWFHAWAFPMQSSKSSRISRSARWWCCPASSY